DLAPGGELLLARHVGRVLDRQDPSAPFAGRGGGERAQGDFEPALAFRRGEGQAARGGRGRLRSRLVEQADDRSEVPAAPQHFGGHLALEREQAARRGVADRDAALRVEGQDARRDRLEDGGQELLLQV